MLPYTPNYYIVLYPAQWFNHEYKLIGSKSSKKATRVVTGLKSREHTNPLFKDLGILPYDKEQAKQKLMHAVYSKYAPKT